VKKNKERDGVRGEEMRNKRKSMRLKITCLIRVVG